jgi:hypothetical protein
MKRCWISMYRDGGNSLQIRRCAGLKIVMDKIQLYTGEYIDRKYFEDTLAELIKENWKKKNISQLNFDHVNCLLSFETISTKTAKCFYESNMGNIITEQAYEKYLKPSNFS